jgi:DNA polymerase III gamma/tau subunit
MATAVSSLATMPTTQQPPPSTAYDNMIPMMMQQMQQIQQSNSDFIIIAKDLLEIIHSVCLVKLNINNNFNYSQSQLTTIKQIAHQTTLNHLLRCWQLINKSIVEINNNLLPALAFEIMLIKIVHILSLPNLKQALLDFNQLNHPNQESNNLDSKLIDEILQSFEGAKII